MTIGVGFIQNQNIYLMADSMHTNVATGGVTIKSNKIVNIYHNNHIKISAISAGCAASTAILNHLKIRLINRKFKINDIINIAYLKNILSALSDGYYKKWRSQYPELPEDEFAVIHIIIGITINNTPTLLELLYGPNIKKPPGPHIIEIDYNGGICSTHLSILLAEFGSKTCTPEIIKKTIENLIDNKKLPFCGKPIEIRKI